MYYRYIHTFAAETIAVAKVVVVGHLVLYSQRLVVRNLAEGNILLGKIVAVEVVVVAAVHIGPQAAGRTEDTCLWLTSQRPGSGQRQLPWLVPGEVPAGTAAAIGA